MACNCLHGTPYIDKNGNCNCDNNGVVTSGCEGVLIDGICTGGIKGAPPVVVAPPIVGGGQLDPLSTKRKITNHQVPAACVGLAAPSGYHYITNAAGQCVLAVNYDSDTTKFSSILSSLLGTGQTNGIGASLGSALSGGKGLLILGGVVAAAAYAFSKTKGSTRVRSVMTKSY